MFWFCRADDGDFLEGDVDAAVPISVRGFLSGMADASGRTLVVLVDVVMVRLGVGKDRVGCFEESPSGKRDFSCKNMGFGAFRAADGFKLNS